MTSPPPLPIAEYGVIGDLHTAALVGTQGSVDWWCAPRFDSPSVFGALLDPAAGGAWSIAPEAPFTADQQYRPGTNVLQTTFRLEAGGAYEVMDFMPAGPGRGGRSTIYRRVEGVRGTVPLRVCFAPRFGYGARPPRFHPRLAGFLGSDGQGDVVALTASPGLEWRFGGAPGREEAETRFVLHAGQTVWFVARYDDDEVRSLEYLQPQAVLQATAAWWDAWLAHLTYHGPHRREIERSALALKLLQYEPSGALVAAPTTSLPEWPGAERNWDYRFTWVRDSSYVLYALQTLGFTAEAEGYLDFFKRVCRRCANRHLPILHTVDGGHSEAERELPHLAGYGGAKPVRVGNGAADQFQLDVYGELLDTLARGHAHQAPAEGVWSAARDMVDWAAAHWSEPDHGIWEARAEPRRHVFSQVMVWTALDRAIRLAEQHHLPADVAAWQRTAGVIRAEVLERGWDSDRQCFVQAYGEPHLDASLLVIPNVGFLPRTDPRVRSTLEAVRRELGAGPEELVYRYCGPDGLPAGEGAFVACSFWMIQNLALVGELDEAERLFGLMLRRGGRLGLFAEEIHPGTGEWLGNYPLGLSHAGLLNTAVILEKLRAREVRPADESASDRGCRSAERGLERAHQGGDQGLPAEPRELE